MLTVLHLLTAARMFSVCMESIMAQQAFRDTIAAQALVSGGMGLPARSDTETRPGTRVLDSELDIS